MKKLFYLLFLPLLFVACDDDNSKTIELPTDVYEGSKVGSINITGLDETVLSFPSVVLTHYPSSMATVAINNTLMPESSLVITDTRLTMANGTTEFEITSDIPRFTTKVKGAISGAGICTLTGDVKYKPLGVARVYKGLTLRVNNVASADKATAEIKYTATNEKPNEATITLTNLVEGYSSLVATGTLIEGQNNVFDLVATVSNASVKVDVTGTFVKGVLSITVTTTPISVTPPAAG